MLGPVAHDDLSSAIGQLVVRGQFFSDRLAQFRNASAWCVFREAGFQGRDRRRFDVFRRVEIGLACTEATNIDAFGFHRFGLAID